MISRAVTSTCLPISGASSRPIVAASPTASLMVINRSSSAISSAVARP